MTRSKKSGSKASSKASSKGSKGSRKGNPKSGSMNPKAPSYVPPHRRHELFDKGGQPLSMMQAARNAVHTHGRPNWRNPCVVFVSAGMLETSLKIKDILQPVPFKPSLPPVFEQNGSVNGTHQPEQSMPPPSKPSQQLKKPKEARIRSKRSEPAEDVVVFSGRAKVSLPCSDSRSVSKSRDLESTQRDQQPDQLLQTQSSPGDAAVFSPPLKSKKRRHRNRRGRTQGEELMSIEMKGDQAESHTDDGWDRNSAYNGKSKSEDEAAMLDYITNIRAQSSDQELELQAMCRNTASIQISSAADSETANGTTSVTTQKTVATNVAPTATLVDVLAENYGAGTGENDHDEDAVSDVGSEDSIDTDAQAELDLQAAFDHLGADDSLFKNTADVMTDEQLAQRLAKQKELGLGSTDVVLLDGGEDELQVSDLETLEEQARSYTRLAKSRSETRSKLAASSAFVDSIEEDPYGDFDIMDRERTSIQYGGTKKGIPPQLFLSDSELEQTVIAAWEKDKAAKKKRRQEREALRAEGLLTKNGKPDLKAKYKEGLTWEDIKTEISEFLMSESERLALPPMDKHRRKIIHELAQTFNVKTQSSGTGDKRYPVLFRQEKSLPWSMTHWANVERRFARRFFPRGDLPKRSSAFSGPSGGSAFMRYRDGDVVGADAPELGMDNRGRALLEKMGWNKGDALGTDKNKGILQPVAQVVKTTKFGLG